MPSSEASSPFVSHPGRVGVGRTRTLAGSPARSRPVGAVRLRFGRGAGNSLTGFGARRWVGRAAVGEVRNRVGRQSQFGGPTRKPLRVFRLGTQNFGLPRSENPRVDGSIPSLATTPNSLILMPLSPRQGGHRASMAGTIGLFGTGCRPLHRKPPSNWQIASHSAGRSHAPQPD